MVGDKHFWLFCAELIFNIIALCVAFEAYKEFKAIEKENDMAIQHLAEGQFRGQFGIST